MLPTLRDGGDWYIGDTFSARRRVRPPPLVFLLCPCLAVAAHPLIPHQRSNTSSGTLSPSSRPMIRLGSFVSASPEWYAVGHFCSANASPTLLVPLPLACPPDKHTVARGCGGPGSRVSWRGHGHGSSIPLPLLLFLPLLFFLSLSPSLPPLSLLLPLPATCPLVHLSRPPPSKANSPPC